LEAFTVLTLRLRSLAMAIVPSALG
jgi:hypothetical protein